MSVRAYTLIVTADQIPPWDSAHGTPSLEYFGGFLYLTLESGISGKGHTA